MHVMAFLKHTLNIILVSEHNQFNVNSIKNCISNIKKKEIKEFFAYFYNDSCKVSGGPPISCWMTKFFCISYFFF